MKKTDAKNFPLIKMIVFNVYEKKTKSEWVEKGKNYFN